MLNKFKFKIQNEIIALFALIIITTVLTLYYNYTKKKVSDDYKQIIENVYFKKTINLTSLIFSNFSKSSTVMK